MSIISIKFLNGVCGAGKTYAMAAWANKQARLGQKVLLVQPTTRLVNETVTTTFPAINVTARTTQITSKTHPWKVQDTIDQYLKTTDDEGEILVITHSAFFGLKHFSNSHRWLAILDEIPAVERSFELNIPDTHELLTRHIEVTDRSHSEYWSIAAKNEAAIQGIARNKHGGEVYDRFREFADTLLSPHWSTYVNAQNYQRLTQEVDVTGVARKLVGSAFMQPTVFAPFKEVIIAGACFEESLLYILWSNLANPNIKVNFENWSDRFDLRHREHTNGALLDIYYGLDCPWSKNVRDKVVTLADGSEATVLRAITEKAQEMVGSNRIAVFANVDVESELFEDCERLPNVSHGLNTFQNIDHAFLVSALNPPPSHFNFLKRFCDIEPDVVQTAMFRQAVYQAANRTSIRDPKNQNRKMWFVPDSGTAYWLEGMYPGCRVHDLGLFAKGQIISHGKPGRPKQHKDGAAKAKAYRERRDYRERIIDERLIRLDVVNGLGHQNSDRDRTMVLEVIEAMTEPPNLSLVTIDPTKFNGTFFKDKFSKKGDPFEGTFDDLVRLYRVSSETEFGSKESSWAWSPSMFVVNNGAQTSRGYANIAFVRNVILDFDGGDLSPDQFVAFFPGWRMVIHSSWSHTPERAKWRVLIPTDYLLDIEGYKLITGYIMSRLNDMGYWTEKELRERPSRRGLKSFRGTHGFDVTKLNPACVLFVPAKRPASFFRDVEGEPIRVYDLMKQIEPPKLEEIRQIEVNPPPANEPLPLNLTAPMKAMAERLRAEKNGIFVQRKQERIKEAVQGWSEFDWAGRRDEGIWVLAIRLRNAGCDMQEACSVADQVIRSSRSTNKRSDCEKAKRAINRLIR